MRCAGFSVQTDAFFPVSGSQILSAVPSSMDDVQVLFGRLKEHTVTVLTWGVKNVAHNVERVCESVSSLGYLAQGVLSVWGMMKCLIGESGRALTENLTLGKSYIDGTRIGNTIGYFLGGGIHKDISSKRFANVASNVAMIPLRIWDFLSYVESCGLTVKSAISQAAGSIRCFGLEKQFQGIPIIPGLVVLASALWITDRLEFAAKGKDLVHYLSGAASSACDIAQVVLSVVASECPFGIAFLGALSAGFGLAAFFADPDAQ